MNCNTDLPEYVRHLGTERKESLLKSRRRREKVYSPFPVLLVSFTLGDGQLRGAEEPEGTGARSSRHPSQVGTLAQCMQSCVTIGDAAASSRSGPKGKKGERN